MKKYPNFWDWAIPLVFHDRRSILPFIFIPRLYACWQVWIDADKVETTSYRSQHRNYMMNYVLFVRRELMMEGILELIENVLKQ